MVGKRSALDEKLIKLARQRKSPVEISEALDGKISPEAAEKRIHDILREKDYFTLDEIRMLHLEELMETQERFKQLADEGDQKSYGTLARTQVTIGQVIENLSKGNFNEKMMQVNELHAKVMIDAISVAFEKAIQELNKRYPEIEYSELAEILEDSLPLAVSSIKSHVED